MQLIISQQSTDAIHVLHVPEDADLDTLSQLVQVELGIPVNQQILEFEGNKVRPGTTLANQGVTDGSSIKCIRQSRQSVSFEGFFNASAERMVEIGQSDPYILAQLKSQLPDMANLIEASDVAGLRMMVMKMVMKNHKVGFDQKQELVALQNADPMDPETQRKIEEKIRQENVDENYKAALENLPESFAQVSMLYVNIQLNGTPVKAFVDSGAQVTIMSKRLADQCGVGRLIDTRMVTTLQGVGSGKSVGRIHAAQLKFGNTFIVASITVMEGNSVDFLLGLDNLKRLRGVINLERNVLSLDGASGKEEVPFLTDGELPVGIFKEPADGSVGANGPSASTESGSSAATNNTAGADAQKADSAGNTSGNSV